MGFYWKADEMFSLSPMNSASIMPSSCCSCLSVIELGLYDYGATLLQFNLLCDSIL